MDPVPTRPRRPGRCRASLIATSLLSRRGFRRGCRDHQSHLAAQPWGACASGSIHARPQGCARLGEPRRNAAPGPGGRQSPQNTLSPPRPRLTCTPRGPATATTLRATRSPAASTKAAAIFPSAAGTCHPGQHSGSVARRRWGCQEARERQPLAPPAAGSEPCHTIGSHFWPAPPPRGWFSSLHWVRCRNLFTLLAASANSTIFPLHWLFLVNVKVPFHLDPLPSFAMR